ncbi:hypothetical protein C8R44DRAFT_742332 [Mycena epipterygia]|nr:hypothetical protein C8R44DRAFT_742332 [Mycena epipterygia]
MQARNDLKLPQWLNITAVDYSRLQGFRIFATTPDKKFNFFKIRDEAIRRENEYHEKIEIYKRTSWFNLLKKLKNKEDVRSAKRATRQSNHSLRKLNESMSGFNWAVDPSSKAGDVRVEDIEAAESSNSAEDDLDSSDSNSASHESAPRQSGRDDGGVGLSTSGMQSSQAVPFDAFVVNVTAALAWHISPIFQLLHQFVLFLSMRASSINPPSAIKCASRSPIGLIFVGIRHHLRCPPAPAPAPPPPLRQSGRNIDCGQVSYAFHDKQWAVEVRWVPPGVPAVFIPAGCVNKVDDSEVAPTDLEVLPHLKG